MERDHMSFRHLGRRESGLLLLSVSPLRPLTTDHWPVSAWYWLCPGRNCRQLAWSHCCMLVLTNVSKDKVIHQIVYFKNHYFPLHINNSVSILKSSSTHFLSEAKNKYEVTAFSPCCMRPCSDYKDSTLCIIYLLLFSHLLHNIINIGRNDGTKLKANSLVFCFFESFLLFWSQKHIK